MKYQFLMVLDFVMEVTGTYHSGSSWLKGFKSTKKAHIEFTALQTAGQLNTDHYVHVFLLRKLQKDFPIL